MFVNVYMKNSPPSTRMVNYGIALALFGILVFSLLMSSIEGFKEGNEKKEDEKKEDEKKEDEKKEDEKKEDEKKDFKISHPMLTKEDADKLVKKLMATNSA
jgi:hypothetical protein